MAWYRQTIETLGQPIADTTQAHTSPRLLKAITIRFNAAPTTSEDIAVTLDSALGALYDATIYSLDPSLASTTAVLLTDINLPFSKGDALRTTFTNTDATSIGIQVYFSDGWA